MRSNARTCAQTRIQAPRTWDFSSNACGQLLNIEILKGKRETPSLWKESEEWLSEH